MPCELRHLSERGVFPDEDLVLRVPVGAHLERERETDVMLPSAQQGSSRGPHTGTHQLVGVLRPGQVAHLGAGVDALQGLPCQGVPEADAAVSGAAAGGEEAVLVWRPGDGFHCSQVLRVLLHGAQAGVVPDKELEERRDVSKPELQSCACNAHRARRCTGTDGKWLGNVMASHSSAQAHAAQPSTLTPISQTLSSAEEPPDHKSPQVKHIKPKIWHL